MKTLSANKVFNLSQDQASSAPGREKYQNTILVRTVRQTTKYALGPLSQTQGTGEGIT